MGGVVLNIAGIALKQNQKKNLSLPPDFTNFLFSHSKRNHHLWHLDSIGLRKKSRLKRGVPPALKKRLISLHCLKRLCRNKKSSLWPADTPFKFNSRRPSFYFDQPVYIDIKNRRLRHFFPGSGKKNTAGGFDPGLITYAYSQILAAHKGMLLHGACVVRKRKAYLFLAGSGGGKTTAARLCRRYRVIGDDVIAVKKKGRAFYAFATPWKQADFIRPDSYSSAPLEAVFFLKKSRRIAFYPLKKEEALARILLYHCHFFLYTEMPLLEDLFFNCAALVKSLPAYSMEFSRSKGFWPELAKLKIKSKR